MSLCALYVVFRYSASGLETGKFTGLPEERRFCCLLCEFCETEDMKSMSCLIVYSDLKAALS